MAKSNFLNKNSAYIGSLVSYLEDIKPYHSKLSEIAEEYQFYESMNVKFEERTFERTKIDAANLYNFFSSGNDDSFKEMPLKMLDTSLRGTLYPAEPVPDFGIVPHVYSKKAFDGPGAASVLIARNGDRANAELLVEGHDYFLSHGGIQFKVWQNKVPKTNEYGEWLDLNGNVIDRVANPTAIPAYVWESKWVDTRDQNLISLASEQARILALDTSNPASAVNQIKALLLQVAALSLPSHIVPMLNVHLATINKPDLPRDYEELLANLQEQNITPPTGFDGWIGNDGIDTINGVTKFFTYVDEALSALTPTLAIFPRMFAEESLRTAGVQESELMEPGASNLHTSARIWFKDPIGLPPETTAYSEQWNIIKVNPIAYSRPLKTSPRVTDARLIMHGDGFKNAVQATWTVQFTSSTTYIVSYTTSTESVSLVPMSAPSFKDLWVHFTLYQGSIGFAVGDTFTFETFARKPSYLVHGSVSGWRKSVVVDELYNDIISFKIQKPTPELFKLVNNPYRLNTYDTTPFDTTRYDAGNRGRNLKIDAAQRVDDVTPDGKNNWYIGRPNGPGIITVTVSDDAPSMLYTLTPTPLYPAVPTGWLVSRADVGVVGHLSIDIVDIFSDEYVTIEAKDIDGSDPDMLQILQLEITGDDFQLWNGQDTIILNSNNNVDLVDMPAMTVTLPGPSDVVLVDKRFDDRISINLQYNSVFVKPDLEPLAPISLNPFFIDTSTNLGLVQLENTSPETSILSTWLPLTVQGYDSFNSPVQFSSAAKYFDVLSAGSGQTIGRLLSTDEPGEAEFVWNDAFAAEYLPLNAEANVVVLTSGFNDRVHARITESVKFLISGGALLLDFMFEDFATVTIKDSQFWNIYTAIEDTINTVISDGPFGGFLPGYDTQLYDDEGSTIINQYEAPKPLGYESGIFESKPYDKEGFAPRTDLGLGPANYDTGIPLVDLFSEAQVLGTIPAGSRTTLQALRYKTISDQLQPFLIGVLGTSGAIDEQSILAQFHANIEAHLALIPSDSALLVPTLNGPFKGIGLPSVGMAMEITIGSADTAKPSSDVTNTGIQDSAMILTILPPLSTDESTFDEGGLDALPDTSALIFLDTLPPIGSPPSVGQTYETYDSPISLVSAPGYAPNAFEIYFNVPSVGTMKTPRAFMWLPAWDAPREVPVVEKTGIGKYRISIPISTDAKLYLMPGL